jgi:hypothetical protein
MRKEINTEKDEFKKRVSVGAPPKYDEKMHLDLMVDVFYDGGGIPEYCAKAKINDDTFHEWKKKHTKFKYAYEVMTQVARVKWQERLMTDPTIINPQFAAMVFRNRFGLNNPKIDIAKSKEIKGKFEVIYDAIKEGMLSNDQITKLSSLISAEANVKTQEQVNDVTAQLQNTKHIISENLPLLEKLIAKMEKE